MRHCKKLALFVLLALAGPSLPLLAQAKAETKARPEDLRAVADEEHWPTKTFDVKYADVGRLQVLLFNIFRAQIQSDGRSMIAVRAPKENMPAIEETIKRFDTPPPAVKNIEITAYLVVASEQADPSASVPSELQAVVKQLKNVFPYQGFRLLDTLVLRSREGARAEMSGVAPGAKTEAAPGLPTIYQLKFDSSRIGSDEKGRVIWINGLRLGSRIPLATSPGSWNYQDVGMAADVDVREGQKVVVGKSGIGGSDRTMFLVLTAKVMD